MINGFGAAIYVYPPKGGEPSTVGTAREWRIDGTLVFSREKPDGPWASHKPKMRAAILVLTGWTFDQYFLSCLENSFLVTLDAGGGCAHKATGKLSRDSVRIIQEGYDRPIAFPDCAIQPAL